MNLSVTYVKFIQNYFIVLLIKLGHHLDECYAFPTQILPNRSIYSNDANTVQLNSNSHLEFNSSNDWHKSGESKMDWSQNESALYCRPHADQIQGVIMQYFDWWSPNNGSWWNMLANSAQSLSSAGITAVWIPPPYKGSHGRMDVGYAVYTQTSLYTRTCN